MVRRKYTRFGKELTKFFNGEKNDHYRTCQRNGQVTTYDIASNARTASNGRCKAADIGTH